MMNMLTVQLRVARLGALTGRVVALAVIGTVVGSSFTFAQDNAGELRQIQLVVSAKCVEASDDCEAALRRDMELTLDFANFVLVEAGRGAPVLEIHGREFHTGWRTIFRNARGEAYRSTRQTGMAGTFHLKAADKVLLSSNHTWPLERRSQRSCAKNRTLAGMLLIDLAGAGVRVPDMIRAWVKLRIFQDLEFNRQLAGLEVSAPKNRGMFVKCDWQEDRLVHQDFRRVGDVAIPALVELMTPYESLWSHASARALGALATPAAIRQLLPFLNVGAFRAFDDACQGLVDSIEQLRTLQEQAIRGLFTGIKQKLQLIELRGALQNIIDVTPGWRAENCRRALLLLNR